ncbi:MAG: protein-L-isoaspartate O-methyltransferase [Campylobacterales bacterium]|nr:protein-L-isoaspartate O-methyltransferase [Campylobacterales bacterium]
MNYKTNEELIEGMKQSGVLRSEEVLKAFECVDRQLFIPSEYSQLPYLDRPLPIGKNQTISQPSTVAFMLELLDVKKGDRVLDIGSGSGWTTGLLGSLTGESGSVEGVERVEELTKIGKSNIAKLGMKNINIEKASSDLGKPGEKFDAILVSASAEDVPNELFDQLKIGARLVIPVKNSIFKFHKISEKNIQMQEYEGFVFVPLIY